MAQLSTKWAAPIDMVAMRRALLVRLFWIRNYGPTHCQKERRTRMTRLPLWAFLAIPIVLATCLGQTPTPDGVPISAPATAVPTSLTPTPAPASPMAMATTVPTEERLTAGLTPTTRPATTLAIAVAAIPADIPEYSRSQWKHWIDEDGDCQDARQETLIQESLVEVTFESGKKCRVAMGRWYGVFTGTYIEAPEDLDIDHLVPLKNAHESGG